MSGTNHAITGSEYPRSQRSSPWSVKSSMRLDRVAGVMEWTRGIGRIAAATAADHATERGVEPFARVGRALVFEASWGGSPLVAGQCHRVVMDARSSSSPRSDARS